MVHASIVAEIENSSDLTAIFGEWPSFHDAKLLALRLEVGNNVGALEADIHVFYMTDEVDARCYFILKNHTFVTLRCEYTWDVEVDGWEHHNELSELNITLNETGDYRFTVEFDGIVGCWAQLRCDKIKLTAVRPIKF